ncbi:MAG: RdgB/HAM1 family non-canonical purine NTP pyrophosphatase [Chloroflexi bacterium]|nr:RdgB/HAM1 family non-canonical purine NTP pyrophosphatase [Chloroflexota bacterium]
MDLILGSHNKGKLREYKALLADAPFTLRLLDEVGLAAFDVQETGETIEANALLKARAYANACHMPVLADDTGLEVDALDGGPGVYSARYGSSDRERCQRLLSELFNVPQEARSARFVCVIAVARPNNGQTITARGVVEGRIAFSMGQGSEGFGYDRIFIPDGYDVTWNAISLAEKNHISHRGRAARALLPLLSHF